MWSFFLIFSMVLLDQLQIFSHLYMIELVGLLRVLLLLKLWHLIFKAFDRVWNFGLLPRLTSYEISGQVFGLIFSFLSNRWIWVVLDGKSSQEYPVNAGVSEGSILGPALFLHDVICDVAVYVDDTTLCSKWDQASDLWQQLELVSELQPDLWDTMHRGKKWLVDFNAGETQLFFFTGLITIVLLMWKWTGLFLKKNHLFKMLGLTFSSKLEWGSYIISIAKTPSKKIGALIYSMKFLSSEVALYLSKSMVHPCMEYCYHV